MNNNIFSESISKKKLPKEPPVCLVYRETQNTASQSIFSCENVLLPNFKLFQKVKVTGLRFFDMAFKLLWV